MVNLLPTIRLGQSILKCKFCSVYKPLKKGLLKYKPRGLFSEFYGIRLKTSSLSFSVCKDILQQFSCYMSWVRDRTRHDIEMGSGDHTQQGSLGTDFYRMLDHYMFVRQMKSAR